MSAAEDDRSLGQLVASAATELSALVHEEIALAKAELRQDVRRGLIGSGAAVAAGVLALFSLPVLSFAAAYGLHGLGLGLVWSFAAVGAAHLLLALVLLLLAKAKLARLEPPRRSLSSARQSAAVLSGVKPRPRKAPKEGSGTAPAGHVSRSSV